MLFEAVTGRTPFRGEALFDLMRAHLEEPPPSPRLFRGDLPPSFEQVILTALAKDPGHRFQSATAMAQALGHAGSELAPDQWRAVSSRGGAIASRPSPTRASVARPTPVSPAPVVAPQPPRSRRNLILGIGGALLLVAGTIVGVVIALRPGEKPAPAEPIARVEPGPEPVPEPSGPDRAEPAGSGSAVRAGSAGPTITHDPPRKVKPPDGVKVEGDVTFVETGGAKLSQPADFNGRAFDPTSYLPKAQALAKKLVDDARLTTFSVEWARPDGKVDLAIPEAEVEYVFRSPARSKLPAGHPKNLPLERPCMIHVDVSRAKVSAYVVTTDDCDDNLVRPPRCNLADVWKQAKLMSFGGEVAKISWLFDEAWYFDSDLKNDGSGDSSTISDVCP